MGITMSFVKFDICVVYFDLLRKGTRSIAHFSFSHSPLTALWTGGEGIAANLVDRHPACITLVGGLYLDPFSTDLKGTQAGFHQIGDIYLEGLALWRWDGTQHILVLAGDTEL